MYILSKFWTLTQNLSQPTWLLWGATVLWALGFDTVYAMSDREDDKRIGVNSSALFFGNYAPLAIAIFFIGTVGLLSWLGVVTHLHIAFWISIVIASAGWIWQYIRLNKKDLPNAAYGEMFRQNVWIGFILLAGMIAESFYS